jgi:ATP-dependent Zn protease
VTLQVQNKNIEVWKLNEEFCVAYVVNQDGENALYRYDNVDKTFQRYTDVEAESGDVSEAPVEKTWFPNEYYMYAIVGLGALSLILFIAMIYFIASRKARHEGRKRKVIKRQEKQRAKEERKLEKQRRFEEKEMAKQRAKEEKKLAKQKKKEN